MSVSLVVLLLSILAVILAVSSYFAVRRMTRPKPPSKVPQFNDRELWLRALGDSVPLKGPSLPSIGVRVANAVREAQYVRGAQPTSDDPFERYMEAMILLYGKDPSCPDSKLEVVKEEPPPVRTRFERLLEKKDD